MKILKKIFKKILAFFEKCFNGKSINIDVDNDGISDININVSTGSGGKIGENSAKDNEEEDI